MLKNYMKEVTGQTLTNFTSEARFYCEENGYDYRKAKEAYDGDRAFEKEQMTKSKKKK